LFIGHEIDGASALIFMTQLHSRHVPILFCM
jgi:hypothetical protein